MSATHVWVVPLELLESHVCPFTAEELDRADAQREFREAKPMPEKCDCCVIKRKAVFAFADAGRHRDVAM